MNRRGVALLAVLWLVTLLASLVGVGLSAARLGQRTSMNRIALLRGRWVAEACIAVAQRRWRERRLADTATIELGQGTRCAWQIADPGTRVNLNTAVRELLIALIGDSTIADALIEERRAAAFVSDSQIPRSLRDVLTVEGSGAVNVSAAPRQVLAALPGLTSEAVERLLARRAVGRPIVSIDELSGLLTLHNRAMLLARYADLARAVTFEPRHLILTATGWIEGERPRATIELVTVPLPERLAVVRRRMW